MTFKKLLLPKLIVLTLVSVSLLSACGKKNEDPNIVMEKFKQNLTEVQSGKIGVKVGVKGVSPTESVDFSGNVDIVFDHRTDATTEQKAEGAEQADPQSSRKGDVRLTLSGGMKAQDKDFTGSLDATIRSFGKEYYIKLDKMETNDERFSSFKPLVTLYLGKWLHVASDLVPPNVRELQEDDAEMVAKREQAKQLFREASLFSVTKDYGVEEINGVKTHHYAVTLDEEGVRQYIIASARLDGRELTDEEIQDSAKIASSIKTLELWIGTDDYYVYQAVISLSDDAFNVSEKSPDAPEVTLDITVTGSSYNEEIQIEVPQGAQEFNPLELLMGFSGMPAPTGEPTGEVVGGDAAGTMLEGSPEAMEAGENGMIGGDAMPPLTDEQKAAMEQAMQQGVIENMPVPTAPIGQ